MSNDTSDSGAGSDDFQPSSREVRLLDLCEPLFMAVCEVRRLAKAGIGLDFTQARADMRRVLKESSQKCLQEGFRGEWQMVEPALRCFADSLVENLGGEDATEWARNRLAAEDPFGIPDPESAFFSDYLLPALERTKRSKHDKDVQVLEVYYACLQLGFLGSYYNRPSELAQMKTSMAGFLPNFFARTARDKITPSTYDHTIRRRLEFDTKPAIWGLVSLTVLFLIVFSCFVRWSYHQATQSLNKSVGDIQKSGRISN